MRGEQMLREIEEIPDVVDRQLRQAAPFRELGEWLRRSEPPFVATCARGSSDHAVTYFKYLIEQKIGVPVASLGPSIASVFNSRLRLRDGILLTVSQSGGSPDLARLQSHAKSGGAHTVALLNVVDSPVGNAADRVLPMLAGPEKAVAATKSFVASLAAMAAVVAHWDDDRKLLEALDSLPDDLAAAQKCDWREAATSIAAAHSLYTIGRGPGFAIAGEAALKLKETSRLHAEAYSAAEVLHGPIALARDRFSALLFSNGDEADASIVHAADSLVSAGARVFVAGADVEGAISLPVIRARHPALNPLCSIVSFYRFAHGLAVALGEDPDKPPLLKKVTQTV